MNLVLVKQAFFENKFANGGKIIIENEAGRANIMAFLKAKNVAFQLNNNEIII
jgi:hypothetical protein